MATGDFSANGGKGCHSQRNKIKKSLISFARRGSLSLQMVELEGIEPSAG